MGHDQDQLTSRRGFLETSAAAAIGGVLASGMSAPAGSSAASKGDTLSIGLIGCGGRGTSAAIQALRADKKTVVTAIGDIFPDRLEQSLELLLKQSPDRVKVSKDRCFLGFDAYQKVIDSGVDVVLLTTPPAFRPLHLKAAIEAGKHSFAECIAAVDAPGIRSFLATSELATRKNLAIVSGFCWRYNAAARAVVEQIRKGAIGEIRAIYATYYRESFVRKYGGQRQPGWTDLEWQLRDWPDFLWLGGDLNIGLSGGHSVDKMAWWMDDLMPIKAVASGGRQFPGEGNTFDHCHVIYEYASGVRGFLGVRSHDGCYMENADYILGSKGICTVGRQPWPEIIGQNPWRYSGPTNDMHQAEQDELFASIRAGRPINDGPRMGRTSLMAIMGRMAAYTGQEITWEQAMHSQESLVPDHLDWTRKVELTPVAMPGKTKFI
jgi:predicted dehydrogenase